MRDRLKTRFFSGKKGRRLMILSVLVAMTFGLYSCSSENDREAADSDRTLSFGITLPSTRAIPYTYLNKIGVFGYSHNGTYTSSIATSKPDYFLNRPVIKPSGSVGWNYYGAVKYWPIDQSINLSFFAYAPYIDVEDTFLLTPTSIAAATGAPMIDYTVPADISKQIDLVWGSCLDQTYTSNGGVVNFDMNHALTKVNFLVKLATAEAGNPFKVTVTELTVKNLIGRSVLNLEKSVADTELWTLTYPATDAELASYKLTPTTGLVNLTLDATVAAATTNFSTLLDGGHYFMFIPQVMKDPKVGLTPPQVEVKYTYTNTLSGETINGVVMLKLATANLDEWKAGKGINYLINISQLEGTEIEFDIESLILNTPWIDGNSGIGIEGEVN